MDIVKSYYYVSIGVLTNTLPNVSSNCPADATNVWHTSTTTYANTDSYACTDRNTNGNNEFINYNYNRTKHSSCCPCSTTHANTDSSASYAASGVLRTETQTLQLSTLPSMSVQSFVYTCILFVLFNVSSKM